MNFDKTYATSKLGCIHSLAEYSKNNIWRWVLEAFVLFRSSEGWIWRLNLYSLLKVQRVLISSGIIHNSNQAKNSWEKWINYRFSERNRTYAFAAQGSYYLRRKSPEISCLMSQKNEWCLLAALIYTLLWLYSLPNRNISYQHIWVIS